MDDFLHSLRSRVFAKDRQVPRAIRDRPIVFIGPPSQEIRRIGASFARSLGFGFHDVSMKRPTLPSCESGSTLGLRWDPASEKVILDAYLARASLEEAETIAARTPEAVFVLVFCDPLRRAFGVAGRKALRRLAEGEPEQAMEALLCEPVSYSFYDEIHDTWREAAGSRLVTVLHDGAGVADVARGIAAGLDEERNRIELAGGARASGDGYLPLFPHRDRSRTASLTTDETGALVAEMANWLLPHAIAYHGSFGAELSDRWVRRLVNAAEPEIACVYLEATEGRDLVG